jgi:hypothetical protein
MRASALVFALLVSTSTLFAQWNGPSGNAVTTPHNVGIQTGTDTPVTPLDVGFWKGKPAGTGGVVGAQASVSGDLFAGLAGYTDGTETTPIGRVRLTSNVNEGYLQWNLFYAGPAIGLKKFDANKPGWDIAMSGISDSMSIRRWHEVSGVAVPVLFASFKQVYEPVITGNTVLQLNGGMSAAGGAYFTGKVRANNIQAHYQDIAEWVPATEDLEPGTVVVLNPAKDNEVFASSRAYDTAVAGVVSPAPGLILGEEGASKEMIATTGRVRVKVDARKRPIRTGDLLTTGTLAGTAMASVPVKVGGVTMHRPGTILGKALESRESGVGEILVLLSLQ